MSQDILITEEMLLNDPTLAQAGYKVGDRLPDPAGHVLPDQPVQPVQEEQAPTEKPAQAPVAPSAQANQEFKVMDRDGAFVRSYTFDIHREEAEEKAKQFADKIGGTVVTK